MEHHMTGRRIAALLCLICAAGAAFALEGAPNDKRTWKEPFDAEPFPPWDRPWDAIWLSSLFHAYTDNAQWPSGTKPGIRQLAQLAMNILEGRVPETDQLQMFLALDPQGIRLLLRMYLDPPSRQASGQAADQLRMIGRFLEGGRPASLEGQALLEYRELFDALCLSLAISPASIDGREELFPGQEVSPGTLPGTFQIRVSPPNPKHTPQPSFITWPAKTPPELLPLTPSPTPLERPTPTPILATVPLHPVETVEPTTVIVTPPPTFPPWWHTYGIATRTPAALSTRPGYSPTATPGAVPADTGALQNPPGPSPTPAPRP